MQKKTIRGVAGRGRVRGVRVDMNEEAVIVKIKKKLLEWGCERRIEVFVKIQKKSGEGGGGGQVGGRRPGWM